MADITRNAGVAMGGKRILLLGAGGAARGVVLPLLQERPQELFIANRTVATAQTLVAQFQEAGQAVDGLRAGGFEQPEGQFDIVINATSASLAGDLPPVPATVFGSHTLALDMMYGAQPTVFMDFAAQHGAQVRDGLGMLVEQAAEAFDVWRGVRPQTQDLLAQLRGSL